MADLAGVRTRRKEIGSLRHSRRHRPSESASEVAAAEAGTNTADVAADMTLADGAEAEDTAAEAVGIAEDSSALGRAAERAKAAEAEDVGCSSRSRRCTDARG